MAILTKQENMFGLDSNHLTELINDPILKSFILKSLSKWHKNGLFVH